MKRKLIVLLVLTLGFSSPYLYADAAKANVGAKTATTTI